MTDIITRSAGKLSSFDPEKRTVDLVLATETPVRRRSYDGDFDEILTVSKAAINVERLDGMSFLDQHDSYSGLEARLGSIVPGSLRFEGKTAVVTAKISRNEKGEALFRDLEDGHVIPVSVGYRIEKEERTEARNGGVATVRISRWEPREISAVSVPADPNAKTRSIEKDTQNMTTTNINTRSEADEARIIELGTMARMSDLAAEAVRSGESLADFRTRLLDAMAEKSEATKIDNKHDTFGVAARDHLGARVDALTARMTGGTPGNGAQFMHHTLLDHARGIVESTGVDVRSLSRDEIIGRAMQVRSAGMHTTSDFSILLQQSGRRVLMDAYQAAQSPLKTRIARASTANDFRKKNMAKISDGGLLLKVNEAGEIKATTRTEYAEGYALATFARLFPISRQAIINDDLNAFADWNAMVGRMAAITENMELYKLLTESSGAGPVMGEDGKRMFHADHGNLGTPAALSVESLSLARAAMRKQKTLDASARLNIQPAILMVGPDKETEAEKILADLAATTVAEQNPFAGRLELAVESQMDGNGWYLFAAPGTVPAFEYSYLSGAPGVQVGMQEEFNVLGMTYRAFTDFGCGPVDFRGAYRNAGA